MTSVQNENIFIGMKGTVLALDRATGAEVWRTPLAGCDFVNVVLDGGELFATSKGEIFCLDAATGQLRWANGLKGLGFGLISIATTDGSSMTVMAQYIRQQQAASASSAASPAATGG